MRNLVAAISYRIVQLVWLPFTTVGYVVFVGKIIAHSRRTGAASTVLASLYTRWIQQKLGLRRDEACARLMAVMPSVPHPEWLFAAFQPAIVAHRVTGYVPAYYRYPYVGQAPFSHQPSARTSYYDAVLAQHLGSIAQLVVLGAGFDTRSYGLPADADVRCFEIDQPATQAFKRAMVEKTGLDTARVTFVSADFEREDWYEKLVASGFDPSKPTLFLWESVSMYLDREAVEHTLRRVAETAPGNVVAFDYFSAQLIASRSLLMRYARAVVRVTGEPFKFGIDNTPPVQQQVEAFLKSCGLSLVEQRDFGAEGGGRRAQAGFAVAAVPSRGRCVRAAS